MTDLSKGRLSRRSLLRGGAGAGLGLLALGVIGCSDDDSDGGSSDDSASSSPDVTFDRDYIVWAHTAALNTLDPSVGGSTQALPHNIYERLLDYEVKDRPDGHVQYTGGGGVSSKLAESWNISGATVTFKLRQGIKFYPSRNELTAEDVKWSFIRAFNAKGNGSINNGLFAGLTKPDSQIEVLGKYEVKFTFLDNLGNPQINPMSVPTFPFWIPILDSVEAQKHITQEDGNQWAEKYLVENSLGTGPYFVKSKTPGVETVLEYVGDEFYGRPAPAFKRIILRTFTSFSDIVPLVKTGEVDGAIGLPIPEVENLAAAGKQVIFEDTPNLLRAFFAIEHPALSNKLVRQALALAVPEEQVLKGVLSGRGENVYSIYNPKDPAAKPSLEKYKFDLNKAKDLLKQSGVPTPFDLTVFYDGGNAIHEDVALLLKDTWSQLGINVSVTGQPSAQWGQAKTQRRAQVNGGGAVDLLSGVILESSSIWFDDPQPVVQFWLKSPGPGSYNYGGFKNAELDALHEKWGQNGSDLKGRTDAYARIEQIVAEELPLYVIVNQGQNVVLAPGLKGFRVVADEAPRYWSLKA